MPNSPFWATGGAGKDSWSRKRGNRNPETGTGPSWNLPGKGKKLQEVKELLWELDATGVVCDDELSPAQLRNMEQILDTKIMDRTMVILDIFAARAHTREGKIQVELAQLKYRAVRLVGMRDSPSRLGGGIGNQGAWREETGDRQRRIHDRIRQLKRELEEVKRHREIQRKQRQSSQVMTAAIVG